jgi:hypothetical protein
MAAIGVADVGSKRGDFNVNIAARNNYDAEFCSDGEAAREKFFDSSWNRVGGDVIIGGNAAEQFIAHTSAYQKSLLATGAKRTANLLRKLTRRKRSFHNLIIRPRGWARQAARCELFRDGS